MVGSNVVTFHAVSNGYIIRIMEALLLACIKRLSQSSPRGAQLLPGIKNGRMCGELWLVSALRCA